MSTNLRIAAATAMIVLCCPCGMAADLTPSVSIIQLLANPEKYDGKRVKVIGFVTLGFEANGVYLHQEDAEHGLTDNGLWLDDASTILKHRTDQKRYLEQYGHKYDLIDATFQARRFNLFGGRLINITRLQVWSEVAPSKASATRARPTYRAESRADIVSTAMPRPASARQARAD